MSEIEFLLSWTLGSLEDNEVKGWQDLGHKLEVLSQYQSCSILPLQMRGVSVLVRVSIDCQLNRI